MLAFSSLKVQVYFTFFASFALAALQNVTVDDAVLTATLQYLPSESSWHQGNNCTICLAKPDPLLTYNGTWHDTTYRLGDTRQEFRFTFTGSALYIFFITANIITNDTAIIHTDVDFVLDGITVSGYTHDPSATGEDYQYNIPVYVNESLVLGEHTMLVLPVESENFQVLMLFDYLIYTTDTSISGSSSLTTTTLSPSASGIFPSASGTATSSKPNIGAIAGGTVGGVFAIALAATTILCRRKSMKSVKDQPVSEEGAVEPFVLSRAVVSTPPTSNRQSDTPTGNVLESTSRNKTDRGSSAMPPPLLDPLAPSTSPSPGGPSSDHEAVLLEEVGQLRDELARLRNLHDPDQDRLDSPLGEPPEYSQGQAL